MHAVGADAEGMKTEIIGSPSAAVAYCILGQGEGLFTERSSMSFMSAGIDVRPAAPGGVVKSFIRQRFGEETFIMTHFSATQDDAWVAVAPPYVGDIISVDIDEVGLYVEQGCMLAISDTVDASVRPSSFSNVLMHEGITILHVKGAGQALLSSFGASAIFELIPGQQMIVDTGYLIGWTPECQMKVGPLGGVVTTLITGEGLVAQFTGPGQVYVQTRHAKGKVSWTYPNREQNTGQ
jgi:uncharacterized protein (TIGR00266 family)